MEIPCRWQGCCNWPMRGLSSRVCPGSAGGRSHCLLRRHLALAFRVWQPAQRKGVLSENDSYTSQADSQMTVSLGALEPWTYGAWKDHCSCFRTAAAQRAHHLRLVCGVLQQALRGRNGRPNAAVDLRRKAEGHCRRGPGALAGAASDGGVGWGSADVHLYVPAS